MENRDPEDMRVSKEEQDYPRERSDNIRFKEGAEKLNQHPNSRSQESTKKQQ